MLLPSTCSTANGVPAGTAPVRLPLPGPSTLRARAVRLSRGRRADARHACTRCAQQRSLDCIRLLPRIPLIPQASTRIVKTNDTTAARWAVRSAGMHAPRRVRVRAARPRRPPIGARRRRGGAGAAHAVAGAAHVGERAGRRPRARQRAVKVVLGQAQDLQVRERAARAPLARQRAPQAVAGQAQQPARRALDGSPPSALGGSAPGGGAVREAAHVHCLAQGLRTGGPPGRGQLGCKRVSGWGAGAAGAREAGPAGGPAGRQLAGQVVVVERQDGERGQRAVAAAPAARQRAAQRVVPRGKQAQLRQRARLAPRGRQPACAGWRCIDRVFRVSRVSGPPRLEASIGASQRRARCGSARRAPTPAAACSRSRPPQPR